MPAESGKKRTGKERHASPTKPAGAKNRIGILKMLKLVDHETGEFIANVRWRSCGHLYVEHAKHVKPKVVEDGKP